MFLFWLLDSLSRAIVLRSRWSGWSLWTSSTDGNDGERVFFSIEALSLAHFILSLFIFFLNFFADQITDKEYLNSRKPSPNYNSSFVNKLLYVWVTPLLWTGFRKSLTMTDLWDISPKVASKNTVPEFLDTYDSMVTKAKTNQVSPSKEGEPVKKKQVSILPALIKVYGGSFLFGSILKVDRKSVV